MSAPSCFSKCLRYLKGSGVRRINARFVGGAGAGGATPNSFDVVVAELNVEIFDGGDHGSLDCLLGEIYGSFYWVVVRLQRL